jgi:hypothetical protein
MRWSLQSKPGGRTTPHCALCVGDQAGTQPTFGHNDPHRHTDESKVSHGRARCLLDTFTLITHSQIDIVLTRLCTQRGAKRVCLPFSCVLVPLRCRAMRGAWERWARVGGEKLIVEDQKRLEIPKLISVDRMRVIGNGFDLEMWCCRVL